MKDFRTLLVWQKSHELTLRIYQATKLFPDDERFGLTSQIRRASASTPTNIAEGCGRSGDKELARFCEIAAGSASEVDYQILLASELKYIDAVTHQDLSTRVNEVQRMLRAFITKLRSN